MKTWIILIPILGIASFFLVFKLYYTPEYRFRHFAQNFDGPLFNWDLEPLAMQYDLSVYDIRRILLEEGFWLEHYIDDWSNFVYYIKDEKELLVATKFVDEKGTFKISDIYIETPSEYNFWFGSADYMKIDGITIHNSSDSHQSEVNKT